MTHPIIPPSPGSQAEKDWDEACDHMALLIKEDVDRMILEEIMAEVKAKHPLILAVSERRLGRFRISADMLRTFPMDAHLLLRDVLVIEAHLVESYAVIEYTCFGPDFAPVNRGDEARFYRAVIERKEGKEPKLISWERTSS